MHLASRPLGDHLSLPPRRPARTADWHHALLLFELFVLGRHGRRARRRPPRGAPRPAPPSGLATRRLRRGHRPHGRRTPPRPRLGRLRLRLPDYLRRRQLAIQIRLRPPQLAPRRRVRDSLSGPACRLYGEFDWAFHNSGGADPIAFQFGNELSHPGPTGLHGTPFVAVNGRMRQEVDYGGDVTVQSGWLWRGDTGKVFRLGGHYY